MNLSPLAVWLTRFSICRNGRTPGIVQPSVEGQQSVARAAYARAGLPTTGTDYVEVSSVLNNIDHHLLGSFCVLLLD